MYFSTSRLLLLIFIALVVGINVSVLVNAWRESASLVNPLMNIGGLVLLGGVVFLYQWSQNRKGKKEKVEKKEA
ncbi:hypothetical protein [Williamwhitmania taraxaci]|uniref:Uncharacterized protein n=1 Tax=Williamwhitmania taraxaci TaxID=1640674 RepID=A0A1G6KZT1_9BACT|nr:hypothetical protein [Williamwhitmania taraxaci]SDC36464.1 hypothetical protein SAMN05216323_10286 [Williamwhitmania taraxaci]